MSNSPREFCLVGYPLLRIAPRATPLPRGIVCACGRWDPRARSATSRTLCASLASHSPRGKTRTRLPPFRSPKGENGGNGNGGYFWGLTFRARCGRIISLGGIIAPKAQFCARFFTFFVGALYTKKNGKSNAFRFFYAFLRLLSYNSDNKRIFSTTFRAICSASSSISRATAPLLLATSANAYKFVVSGLVC